MGSDHVNAMIRPVALRTAPDWRLDPESLSQVARDHAPVYQSAKPFPHVVIDDLFPPELLEEIVAEFPSTSDPGWNHENSAAQLKLQWRDPIELPPATTHFLFLLESPPFLDFLEQLTGITGLVTDPHCFHGGLHQVEPGGYLKVHSDLTFHPRLWLYRRLNLIVYLNADWDDAWGGRLEFWDAAMTGPQEAVAPRFNRTVIFNTEPPCNHGHPDPLASPPGVNRRSVALYYYTSPENPNTARIHSIGNFRARQDMPDEGLDVERWHLFRAFLVDVLPPGLVRRVRTVTRRPR